LVDSSPGAAARQWRALQRWNLPATRNTATRLHIHVSSAADPVQRGTAVSRKRQHCASDANSRLSFHLGGDALPFKHRQPTNAGSAFKCASDARVSTPKAGSGVGVAMAVGNEIRMQRNAANKRRREHMNHPQQVAKEGGRVSPGVPLRYHTLR
jgi:hypothetical protein